MVTWGGGCCWYPEYHVTKIQLKSSAVQRKPADVRKCKISREGDDDIHFRYSLKTHFWNFGVSAVCPAVEMSTVVDTMIRVQYLMPVG